MKHIALLIPTIDRIGGAESQLLLLARGLHERGWRVTVVALSGTGGEAAAELAQAGIASLSLQMRKGLADPRGWWRFQRWLAQARPDVLHAHLPHAAWFARWSRLGASRVAVVDTLHTTATGTLGRRLGYRFSDGLAHRVTAVSTSVAECYRARRMVTPQRLSVIPNGVDTRAFQPDPPLRAEMRRSLSADNAFVWLSAGRIDPVKDHATLLRAFACLPPHTLLLLAGAGPRMTAMECFAADLGIANRVRFLGFQKDLPRWMQAADAYVQSSLWEGLPMSILEASACGLPVVATDVAGTREAVQPERTGLLAPARSPDELADAMLRLMRMPSSRRDAFGTAGRQLVLERYSLSAVLDRWEELYTSLLARQETAVPLAASRTA